MNTQEITEIIKSRFAEAVVSVVLEGSHPFVQVRPENLTALCAFLKEDKGLQFDLLRCVTAIDWPAKNAIEVSYDLISTAHSHTIAVKVILDRSNPRVESVSSIWATANWHEREAFDLMGVFFDHHPGLRRILMPEDWPGHPLRKDYQDIVEYHGLRLNP